MRTLTDLLATTAGRRQLTDAGLWLEPEGFAAALRPPIVPAFTSELLVYATHELYIDYPPSVLAKLRAFGAAPPGPDGRLFIWLDTDRSGADPYAVRIGWPLAGNRRGVRVSPHEHDQRELRFNPIHQATLGRALQSLDAYVAQLPTATRRQAQPRYNALRRLLADPSHPSLAALNAATTQHLLNHEFGGAPRSILLSELLAQGKLSAAIRDFVGAMDDVIAVFNAGVERLQAIDIHPQVSLRKPDYVPLNIACAVDGVRLRLRRVRDGRSTLATAECACGSRYTYPLDPLDELFATGRWSPDVCLLIFLNDLCSGWIAGKSTAIYTLIFHDVLKKVLGRRPIPVLVPAALAQPQAKESRLVHRYVTGAAA